MVNVRMGVRQGPEETRVLVHDGQGTAILKARLPSKPVHDRALVVLCEAVALWYGRPVRAVLVADEPERFCGTNPLLESVDGVYRTALFELHLESGDRPARRPGVGGLGDFRDVRQLVLFEVAQ